MKTTHKILLLILSTAFVLFAYVWSTGDNSDRTIPEIKQVEKVAPTAKNVSSKFFDNISSLEKHLAENPTDTTHILRLARLYQDGHRAELAIDWYRKLLEINPEYVQARLDLVNCLGMVEKWDKALAETEIILKDHPQNGSALYNKAAIFANMNRMDEAKVLWEKVLTMTDDPNIRAMTSAALARIKKDA